MPTLIVRLVLPVLITAINIGAHRMNTEPNLICCGWDEVFIIEPGVTIDADGSFARLWSWRAPHSPEIPESAHKWFATTDDCKPAGANILISSSSGGVALIRREDKACLFYAYARNAHSACMLPGSRIAVAASTGGDAIMIFDQNRSGAEAVAQGSLKGAHGVYWDDARQRLWALGEDELLLVELADADDPSIIVHNRWDLPTHGGHDLSPVAGADAFHITTNSHVYIFEDGEFQEQGNIGSELRVKSVDHEASSGRLVYHQASSDHWWSDTIRFLDADPIRLHGQRLYKIRWDSDRGGREDR